MIILLSILLIIVVLVLIRTYHCLYYTRELVIKGYKIKSEWSRSNGWLYRYYSPNEDIGRSLSDSIKRQKLLDKIEKFNIKDGDILIENYDNNNR